MSAGVPSWNRSKTEYQFGEEQADAIVETLSYQLENLEKVLIWYPLEKHNIIHSSITTPFPRPSTAGQGSLDCLPLELLHDVLLRLDLQSLFKLRQTSLRSRETVNSLSQYQTVVKYGLNLLCALFQTKLASRISLLDFYDALCTSACGVCGEFGGYMSLTSWTRCCLECLKSAPELRVRTLASARKRLGLTKTQADQLNSFRILPDMCYMGGFSKSRVAIVSAHQATLVSGKQQDVVTPHSGTQAMRIRSRKLAFNASCSLPYYDRRTGQIERGLNCAGCRISFDYMSQDPEDLDEPTPTDWFDETADKLYNEEYAARNKLYGRNGFLEHFRWCKEAQRFWEASDQGRMLAEELMLHAYLEADFNLSEELLMYALMEYDPEVAADIYMPSWMEDDSDWENVDLEEPDWEE